MLKEQIAELGAHIALLNGRKECKVILQIFENIKNGNKIYVNLIDLRELINNFKPSSEMELEIKKQILSQVHSMISYIKNGNRK